MRGWLALLVAGLCAACPHDLRRPVSDRAAQPEGSRDLSADRPGPRPDFPPRPDRGCPSPCVTTFAGACTFEGFDDGAAPYARFRSPVSLIFEPATGSLLVADSGNERIRRISLPDGRVTTVAGSGTAGHTDGPALGASFATPHGLAVDGSGAVLVSDHFTHTIRRIAGGNVTTIAGSPNLPGSTDGIGPAARFFHPEGLLLDSSGTLLVADMWNGRIRRVDLTTYQVTTLAGDGGWHHDGPLLSAGISYPTALLAGSGDTVYVSEQYCVRRISGGQVTTFAGADFGGSADGALADARFDNPMAMVFDASGAMLVADRENNEIRRIDLAQQRVSTYAGLLGSGYRDDTGTQARFNGPWGLAVDPSGTIYVAEFSSHCIRMIR